MNSYTRYKSRILLIIILILVLGTTGLWSWIKIDTMNFLEQREKLVIIKRNTKDFKQQNFDSMYAETEKFIKNIPFYIKYSLDEGVLSTFFLSISEASRKDKSKDYLKLLIDFARQNPKSPHTPYAYLYLGSEKNFQRSFAEAIEYFDKALASEKSIGGIFNFLYENRSLEFTAYYQRGVVKMLMKDFESAESDFMISQKKIPESDMSFFSKVRIKGRLCEALLLQNKDAKALALMDELLKISEDKQALMKTADLFLKQKALSKEAALLEKNNQGPDIKEMYVQKLSQLAKNVYDRLKLTADLPFENRKVARIVNHYRNLKSELSGEFGETLKP